MQLGIDISQIVYLGSGVARFTTGLVKAILQYDKNNQWTFFFSSFRQKLPEKIKEKIISRNFKLIQWPIPPTLLSFLWNDLHNFSKRYTLHVTRLNSLDWFITSDWTESPLSVNKATIVHDLVFKRYPQTVHQTILHTQSKRLAIVAKESKIIFADSQSTANDLTKYYGIKKELIVVNYPGVELQSTLKNPEEILKKYNLHKPFILTVGKREPRKNLDRLFEAYEKIKFAHEKTPLVVVGMEGWGDQKNFSKKVVYLGYVSDEDLTALYQSALFFVYPSLYEGFGYPIVEAMLNNCPVATSNTSSMKEISQGCAQLFDPENVDSIKNSLQKLINDEVLRKTLIKAGRVRAKSFTWEKYYNTLIQSLSLETKQQGN